MVQGVEELIFTSEDDSVLITLTNGETIELFGDGVIHRKVNEDIVESSII